MINIKKSQPEPSSLSKERAKTNGSYSTPEILEQLKADFHNKCYICEFTPLSINVEHFVSHKGDTTLKFSWDNLFWSCSHCNNIKLGLYDNILNCTDKEDDVENAIKLVMTNPLPFTEVEVIPQRDEEKVHNTVELLKKVYNGNTHMKVIESHTLRQFLASELLKFINNLSFLLTAKTKDMKLFYQMQIQEQLDDSSPFVSFKRWILKDEPHLQQKLTQLNVITNIS